MSQIKILHIEDEEMYQELVREILMEQGFEIYSAGTGTEGLEILEDVKPDLLILDINLPDADGYEICERLRQQEQWAALPILMATVRRHPDEWRKGFSVGASDYVAKPLHGPELLARIQSCLNGKTAQGDGTTNPEVLMIRATLIGNRGAFDVFVRQYKDALLEDMLGHAKNIAEAEDVVAMAFARTYEHLNRFRGQSSFYTWLYSIALHELHHRWRHQHKAVALQNLRPKDHAAIARDEETRNPSAPEISPASHVALLDEALIQVPDQYRKILQWHFIQGLPYADIARRLALPLGTVKSRISKAQHLLRDAWHAMDARRQA